MVQSIKTEVIYYGVNGDFEFEFNLCGCCQMRLLKEPVNDNASLLKALQRGIIRSRVIIIVGNLHGENGTINLVSKAIGYACETLDTNVFEVNSNEPIILIKNSVPLITKDGTFGGCIIESGPQSMVFLSEDKKIRKEIMNSLVHSYIADLSRFPTQLQSTEEVNLTEEAKEEIAEITETDTTVSEAILEEINEEPNEAPMEFEDFSTFSENTVNTPEEDPYNINNLPTSENVDVVIDEYSTNEEYETENAHEYYSAKEVSSSERKINIATLILSVILLALLAFIVYSFIYLPLSSGISVAKNFQNVFRFLKGI